MKIINLTSHIISVTGHPEIKPSGTVAKLNSSLSKVADVEGIPILTCSLTGVSNVPEPNGDLFIVPSYIRLALPSRKDLASPAKLIRNTNGAVIGCGALEVNP